MSKRTSTDKPAQEAQQTQDRMNEVYTAHQVHTLAQLLYHRIVAARQPAPGWPAAAPHGPAPSAPMPGASWGQPTPTGFFYWYP